jgi:hypothetical protein
MGGFQPILTLLGYGQIVIYCLHRLGLASILCYIIVVTSQDGSES